jgi:AcrR family transcriptional regulator
MTFSPLADTEVEARPERLVAAARDLANETGSAAFTVQQVTMRAGLSLKAFYSCFPGKDDLLIALIGADSEIGAAVLGERIGNRTGPAAVEAYFVELFAMLTLPGAIGYAGVLATEHRRLGEQHNAQERRAIAPMIDLLARFLSTGDPERDAETMFAVLLMGIHDVVLGRVTNTRELAHYLHRFCTQGVGHGGQ